MAHEDPLSTPMMKQFRDIKQQYPDALLLFRCGDFYETYCEDAVTAAKILNITLTHRNNKNASPIEMAGFPFHALDTYLPKLVRAGHRVAICDQLEDPKLAKKLVKRGVTELVTPGVSYADTAIGDKENNFVACVSYAKEKNSDRVGASFLDISTGEYFIAEGNGISVAKLLTNFAPKEVLFLRGMRDRFQADFGDRFFTFELDEWMMTTQAAQDRLEKQFGVANLKGFGIAAGAILHYLDMTQHLQTGHIRHLARIEQDRYVWLDRFTIRNLELIQGITPESKTLLEVLDQTVSPMGNRLLRRWLAFPLKEVQPIRMRQSMVECFFRHPDLRDGIRRQIERMQDLERLVSKVATGRIGPQSLRQIAYALQAVEKIQQLIAPIESNNHLTQLATQLNPCTDIRERILREIALDAPVQQGKTGTIAPGVNTELDEYRSIQNNNLSYLKAIEKREIEKTGIVSLKVAFNNVFGYYLEVRNTFKDKVPPEWIRKQTLVNAERYITPELKEYEEKIARAEEQSASIENQLYGNLLAAVQDYVKTIQNDAIVVAQLDCLIAFAVAAQLHKYVCPDINDSLVIDIRQGRHPVIEKELPLGERYVPNDILLDNERQQIIIITGPNMAGKSALLRQTALIVLLAQIGCFVPAEAARIGLVDKIFTRVGASDNISLGESTFMVEMTEASNILNNVSSRSLVLFDELGRGTSTYDGISIAWAIVEYLHENAKGHPRTLFATHYHELNEMEKNFSRIKNYNVSVKEVDGKVIFLRKLERGGSEHSFGIHVAEIAGMPRSIVKRANVILKQLESDNSQVGKVGKPTAEIAASREGMQLSFFQLDDPVLCQVRDEILGLDVNNLTPLEALNKLNDIKKIVSGK